MIRRIDELGRIVIPKEIRKNLKIRDGENLEILIENNEIILKKFSKMEDLTSWTKEIVEIVNRVTKCEIAITDRDIFLETSGENIKNLKSQNLSEELLNLINKRESSNDQNVQKIRLSLKDYVTGYFSIVPILIDSDCVGLVVVYSSDIKNPFLNIIGTLIVNLIEQKL